MGRCHGWHEQHDARRRAHTVQRGALFELCDAVLCAPAPVTSVPGLSPEPTFRRSHGSLYKALARGSIDDYRLRGLLAASRPAGWPLVFAVGASTWARCDAETSPERGFYYSASKHSAGQPIVAGWSYQWISQLDWVINSWTAPVDAARIPPGTDATTATIAQVARLAGLLPADGDVPVFVFDAGYDPIALTDALASTRAAIVVRIRSGLIFYPDPEPDQQLSATDSRYGTVTVTAWADLHPKLTGRGRWSKHDTPPIVPGTVVRVHIERLPKPTARAVKTL